jgi:hypothetical protein
MKRIIIFPVILMIILLYSCSTGFQISSDYVRGTDFKKFKTYAWLAPDSSLTDNDDLSVMLGNMIMNSSNTELKKKGMVLDSENPDALFSFKIGTEVVTSYSQSPSLSVGIGVGGPGYYVGGSVPVAGGDLVASSSQTAVLSIQMFDFKTSEAIWFGGARKTVDPIGSNIQKNLQMALHNMFYRLPVRHKVKK